MKTSRLSPIHLLLTSCCVLFLLANECADEQQPANKKPAYTEKNYEVIGESTTEARKDIFDKKDGKGPKGKDGDRHAGLTKLNYELGFGGPSKSDATDGKCACTVTVDTVFERHSIEVTLPKWKGYENASADCKAKWDEFIKNLRKHEETHVAKYDKGFAKAIAAVRKAWKGKQETRTAATCKAACDAAFDALQAALMKALDSELASTETEQAAYDKQTQHGETEGAVLKDCTP